MESVETWNAQSFVRCPIIHQHHQLRNNISLVGDILLYNSGNYISKHCSITNEVSIFMEPVDTVSTLSSFESYFIIGTVSGMFTIKPFGLKDHTGTISTEIINHLNPSTSRSGTPICYVSSNDRFITSLDPETFQTRKVCELETASNCTATSPDHQLLAVVGDTKETKIISLRDKTVPYTLDGHLDHCFAVAWQQSSRYLATGSQDRTTRIYDTRWMNQAIKVVASKQSAVRSLLYIKNTLCIAEDCDYVQMVENNEITLIELFGDITGTCYGHGFMHIGINDRHVGGILSVSKV